MKTEQHWGDIFQAVIKFTDFVLEIVDARNPIGTHNQTIEKFIEKNKPNVEFIIVLNKSDLIPKDVLAAWIRYFKGKNYKVYSTSAKKKRGIVFLFHKLRELGKRGIQNILIVGYPNTGKSTLIQALTKNKKKIGISARAGFTRGIKKIKLTSDLYLIDTPGVIPLDELDETEIAIKACMAADKLSDPLGVVEVIFDVISLSQFEKVYDINLEENDGPEELVEKIGRRHGPLISGGIVNEIEVHKRIVRDWQSNKLHYWTYPPGFKHQVEDNEDHKKIKKIKKSSTMPGIPTSLKNRKKKRKNL